MQFIHETYFVINDILTNKSYFPFIAFNFFNLNTHTYHNFQFEEYKKKKQIELQLQKALSIVNHQPQKKHNYLSANNTHHINKYKKQPIYNKKQYFRKPSKKSTLNIFLPKNRRYAYINIHYLYITVCMIIVGIQNQLHIIIVQYLINHSILRNIK